MHPLNPAVTLFVPRVSRVTQYEMAPNQVNAAGKAVSGLTGEAQGVASGLLSALSSAAGQVQHPEMAAALRDYRAAESQSVKVVPDLVRSLGSRTAGSAADITGGDSDGAAAVAPAIGESQQLGNSLWSNPLTP